MTTSREVVIVGAGPAGSVAAHECAKLGMDVLLVDAASFPRGKVCGCCLNGTALDVLNRIGLGFTLRRLRPTPLRRVQLNYGGRSTTLPFVGGVSLSREAMDAALIEAAVASGAEFRPRTRATVLPNRRVMLDTDGSTTTVQAGVIVAADGLNGRTVAALTGVKPSVAEHSYLGAGAVLAGGDLAAAGDVRMLAGRGGYLGIVRLEDGRIDLAAAFDAAFVRASGGLGEAAATLYREATGREAPELVEAEWCGTPLLTRQPGACSGPGWLAIGDASGYVEPFTGEGMAWAIAAAAAAAPFVQQLLCGEPTAWDDRAESLLGNRRRSCRRLTSALRKPWFCAVGIRALSAAPWLAAPFVRRLHAPAPSLFGFRSPV